MEKTRMLVLSVCLASMLLGCAEAHVPTPCDSCTNATVNGTDALPAGAHPTRVPSTNLPVTSNSSTATNTTSRQTMRPPGPVDPTGRSSPVASAASLLGPCTHLLVPAISVLICGALG